MRKLFFIAIICFLVVSCSTNDTKKIVIGVSQCSEDIWREKLNNELKMATFQHDNIELRFSSANDDDKLQAEQIDSFIAAGVDLLIVSPNQVHTISKVVDKAYDKGIPVILFDRKTDSDKYTAFIGADNYEAGFEMGKFIARQLEGHGKVVEIEGLKGSSPTIERAKGFAKAISKFPDIRIVNRKYGNWQQDDASEAMDSILKETPEFDYVFAQNDRMAVGARKTVLKYGKRAVKYVGIDALPVPGGGIEKVRDGELSASYIYPTRGDLVMQLAVNILEHKSFKRNNYLKGALVTPDNANVLLMQNDEMHKQTLRLRNLHGKVNEYLAQYNHQKIYLFLLIVIVILIIGILTFVQYSLVRQHKVEEETVKAKLQFFTNISHELRTPLTLIAEPVSNILSKGDNLTQQQHKMLGIVNRNISIMLQLVNEILDFRKVQAGKMQLVLSDFNLAETLQQWILPFSSLADKKNINIKIQVPESLMIRADINKVERICYNLMSNAIKYTRQGGVITVQLFEEEEKAVLKIIDSGTGIASDDLPNIFRHFYQARNAKGGTGIGLALVKAYVDLHHGDVRASSEQGKGSTFTVILPLTQKGETRNVAVTQSLQQVIKAEDTGKLNATRNINRLTAPQLLEKPEVLIIDDNADIRSYLQVTLEEYYKISEADDGKKGLEIARKIVPDLIVSDVMMPVMDGIEFCKHLRADAAISHIPVILLTARNLDEQRIEGYESGADAYLVKPFSMNLLISRIDNLLKSRKQLGKILSSPSEQEEMIPLSNEADKDFVERLRKVIQDNLSDSELSVEKIGGEVGLSRVQLYRKVKALTGYSPVEMVRKARLARAKYYLQASEKNISEVAYAVGFTSPSYFSKCYKEEYGVQPGQER